MSPRCPVDLARARAAEEGLKALLTAHPEIGERTARHLAGELPAGRKDAPMTEPLNVEKHAPQVVKLPGDLVARARDLLPRLIGRPELAAVARPTVAAVLRLALSLGLTELEKRTG